MMEKDFAVGDTVFFIGKWTQMLMSAEIQEIKTREDGNIWFRVSGFMVRKEYCFRTEEECLADYKKKCDQIVERYKKEMKTVRDCLVFATKHCLSSAEEYTDYEAQRAFKERCNEIFGEDIFVEDREV